jgi:hypothetical protein
MKDVHEFFLIPTGVSAKVNDIEMECGNALSQPVFDHVIRWGRKPILLGFKEV